MLVRCRVLFLQVRRASALNFMVSSGVKIVTFAEVGCSFFGAELKRRLPGWQRLGDFGR